MEFNAFFLPSEDIEEKPTCTTNALARGSSLIQQIKWQIAAAFI